MYEKYGQPTFPNVKLMLDIIPPLSITSQDPSGQGAVLFYVWSFFFVCRNTKIKLHIFTHHITCAWLCRQFYHWTFTGVWKFSTKLPKLFALQFQYLPTVFYHCNSQFAKYNHIAGSTSLDIFHLKHYRRYQIFLFKTIEQKLNLKWKALPVI